MIKKYRNTFTYLDGVLCSLSDLSILSSLIELLPDSVYWKDKEGKYLGCNQSMLEMANAVCIIGQTDFDMPWAEYAPTIRSNDLMVMELNFPVELEETITIKNGQSAVVLTRKSPLYDEQGQCVGVIGHTVNITNRKQQESVLRSTQEKAQFTLENIVANMPGHVYWKDRNGVYLGCNNRQARSLGFQFGYELVGKTDFDLPWGENHAALFRQNDLRIMQTGETEMIEEKAQVDGKHATVLSYKSPMRTKQGEITGVLGISLDISDRKRIEAELNIAKNCAEEASMAKTEFLENMRHDIRTPLTGIVGFSEIIKAQAEDPKIREYADNLAASSHALLSLMDEVLEAIHVSSGEIPKVKKKFALYSIMQHVTNLNKAKALTKNLNFSCEFDKEIPPYLIGDSVRIHRILLELINNALNFTDSGFVTVKAELAKRQQQEVIIKLIVEDSGIGIPKEQQQEIFIQFKRLIPSYKGIYKGIGLGLAVIKQFIDEINGEIYVESTVQKGTTFTCVIPLKVPLLEDGFGVDSEFAVPVDKVNNLVPTRQNHTSERVLLVEDNIIAQTVARSILSQYGLNVDVAVDGVTALQFCSAYEYQLIFMDIGLPDIDGCQVAQKIRFQSSHTKNQKTPIIALTAHVEDEYVRRCLDSGMNAVLNKPLTQQNCHDLLQKFSLLRDIS